MPREVPPVQDYTPTPSPDSPRVMYLGYNTLEEAQAKGIISIGDPWTLETAYNFGGVFESVTVVIPYGRRTYKQQISSTVTYRELRTGITRLPKTLRALIHLPRATRFLRTALKKDAIDVVVIGGPHLPALLGLIISRFYRIPAVCFIEAFWEDILPQQPYMSSCMKRLLPFWYRLVYRAFPAYQGTPSVNPPYYKKRGMSAERIFPWRQPVDLDRLRLAARDSDQSLAKDLPRPWVVAVGRLHPEKLSEDYIDILHYLLAYGFEGTLILVGSGPLRPHLEQLAQSEGLSHHLHITGTLPMEDAFRIVAASDVYMATMQGSALVEALGAEIPIVAYDNLTHREILAEPECGVLVADRDVQAAGGAILSLLRDRRRREVLQDAARQAATSKFGKEEIAYTNAEPVWILAGRR